MEARVQEANSETASGVPGSDQKGWEQTLAQRRGTEPWAARSQAKISGTSGDEEQGGSHRAAGTGQSGTGLYYSDISYKDRMVRA